MANGQGKVDEPGARLQRLGRFLSVDPDNAALLRDYANEAWQVREYQACVLAVERLVTLGQTVLGDHLMLARALRQQGQATQALGRLRGAAALWPREPAIPIEAAYCHFAEREFEQVLDALPPPPQGDVTDAALAARAEGLRVRALHHLGRLDEAVEAARRFEALHGPHVPVQAAVLAVLVDLSQLQQAVQIAQSLLPAGDDTQAAPYEVAEPLALQALDEQGAERAMHWVDWALARRADDGRIWLLKGLALLQSNQRDAAIPALERAADLMPTHAGSHLGLGWACLLQGERVRARQAFEAAAQASPAFAEVYGSLAVLDATEGHKDAARAQVRRAQGLDRHCASALFALALLEGRQGADIAKLAQAVIARARGSRPDTRSH